MFFPWDIVILGCGQLGSNLKTQLEVEKYRVLGIRRTPVDDDPTWMSLDLDHPEAWNRLTDLPLAKHTVLVAIVTPDERNKEAYQMRYFGVSEYLRQFASSPERNHSVVWVSSTAVFGRHQVGRLDESVRIEPDHWRGDLLAQAERQIMASDALTTVIRFAGLYTLERLLQLKDPAVRSQINPETISNRLHRDDAVSWLMELVLGYLNRKTVPGLIHAVDQGSVPYRQIFELLDGRSTKFKPTFDGRVIDTQYRDLMPELRYPDCASIFNSP